MEHRPSESLKAVANELAALLNSKNAGKDRIDELLGQLNYSKPVSTVSLVPVHPGETGETIGIWKKKTANNEVVYERDNAKSAEWTAWADKQKLYRKKQNKRVVLLGESVARGYFYDPYYTVATELEGTINEVFKSSYCEVVDLARNSITAEELVILGKTCIELQPDAVVIFAGNNWLHSLRHSFSIADYKTMYELFKTASFTGVKTFLEEKFETIILSFLREMGSNLVGKGIPVVFVIPGFNLKDWKSDENGKSLPWLPGNAVQDWLNAKEKAETALADKQYEEAAAAAAQMVGTDPFNPHGYELLATAYINSKKQEEALQCLERGRDALLVSRGGNEHPGMFGVIRKTILARAAEVGIVTVDLADIFNRSADGGIPDRSLYLDYCHLTIKGIKIAMRHTASFLLPLLSGKEIPLAQIMGSRIFPDAEVSSIAHFCAAIHNAHSGQPREILDYHCRQALAYSPIIKRTMLQYIDFTNRRTSTALCKTFEDIITEGKIRQYTAGFALGSFDRGKLLDIPLVNAIADALLMAGLADTRDHIKQLRKQEHAAGEENINLLESFYSTTSFRELVIDPKPNYFQARNVETHYSFIGCDNQVLSFELVYRTTWRYEENKMIEIVLNNEHIVAQLPMSKKWITGNFTSGRLLREGVNKLTIRWPYTSMPLINARYIVSPGSFLHVTLPVLGEIHSFSAADKGKREEAVSDEICSKSFAGEI